MVCGKDGTVGTFKVTPLFAGFYSLKGSTSGKPCGDTGKDGVVCNGSGHDEAFTLEHVKGSLYEIRSSKNNKVCLPSIVSKQLVCDKAKGSLELLIMAPPSAPPLEVMPSPAPQP